MTISLISTFSLAVAFLWLVSMSLEKRRKGGLRLPPGPKGRPLTGHAGLIPPQDTLLAFHEWAKSYGDVVYFNIFGRPIIVLDTIQAADDLLEKRGSIYSDRPNLTFYSLMGWVPNITFMRYSQRFRTHRKLIHSYLSPKACVEFRTIQAQNAHILINGLMQNQGNSEYLIGKFTTSIVMRVAYGHQIVSDDDEYIQLAKNSTYATHSCSTPGATPVDLFPFLQYMPSWVPGTHYAGVARSWKWAVDALHNIPYNNASKQVADGNAKVSFVSSQLEAAITAGRQLSQDDKDDIKGVAAAIYSAGAETTWDTLSSFILAMLLFPECQKRGQEEVDRVIGMDRLPTYNDREGLPYVESVVQEVLRWNPPLPQAVPHASLHDDVYRDMLIPKGATIIPNVKGMSLDKEIYANPDQFNPSRYLPKDQGGNEEPFFPGTFGFGRRICPGRHLAIASIFTVVATIFATLNITTAKDEEGNEIVPKAEFDVGLSSHPKPYQCNFVPRSEKSRRMISEAVEDIEH